MQKGGPISQEKMGDNNISKFFWWNLGFFEIKRFFGIEFH